MRNKFFKILLLIFFLPCFITGCTKNFNYYEDKLYSEETLIGAKDSKSPTSNNVLTREKALQKSVDIFDKGLNIKIDRTQFSESIKISRDYITGNFQLNISWQNLTDKVFYFVVLDASNNEILEVSSTDSRLYQDSIAAVLSQEEINSIISPLLKEINIDPNDYVIKHQAITQDMPKSDISIYLVSTKDGGKDYSITINSSRKVVTRFFTLKESKRIQERETYEKNTSS
ncbi:hypothetical protein [Clostridium sp.]|uniref:hypothetical protein n=1 Tax=Clostridium sp. TaxID=1506 RepID=UPI002FC8BF78